MKPLLPAVIVILALFNDACLAAPTDAQPHATHGAVPFSAEDYARGLKQNDWIKVEVITSASLQGQLVQGRQAKDSNANVTTEEVPLRINDQIALETSKQGITLNLAIPDYYQQTTTTTSAAITELVPTVHVASTATESTKSAAAIIEEPSTTNALSTTASSPTAADSATTEAGAKRSTTTEVLKAQESSEPATAATPEEATTLTTSSDVESTQEPSIETTTVKVKVQLQDDTADDANLVALVEQMFKALTTEAAADEPNESTTTEQSTEMPVSEETIIKETFYQTGNKRAEAIEPTTTNLEEEEVMKLSTTQTTNIEELTTIQSADIEELKSGVETTIEPEMRETNHTTIACLPALSDSNSIAANTSKSSTESILDGTTTTLQATEDLITEQEQEQEQEQQDTAEAEADAEDKNNAGATIAPPLESELESNTEQISEYDLVAHNQRSRAPRVERLRLKEGVEVLFGYSSVKSNK